MRTDLLPPSSSSSSSLLGADGQGIGRGGVGGDGDSRNDRWRDSRSGWLEETEVGRGGEGEGEDDDDDDDDDNDSETEVPSMLSCSRIRRWASVMPLSIDWSRVE